MLRSGGEWFIWKLLHDETSSYSDLLLNGAEEFSYFLPMPGTGLTLPDSLTLPLPGAKLCIRALNPY